MWICKQCGMLFDTADSVCPECGEKVVPLDDAFSFQEQLFELEGNDRARSVFDNLRAQYEQSRTDVRKAKKKLEEAEAHSQRCGEILTDFYKLTCEGAPEATEEDQTAVDENIDEWNDEWNGGSF